MDEGKRPKKEKPIGWWDSNQQTPGFETGAQPLCCNHDPLS